MESKTGWRRAAARPEDGLVGIRPWILSLGLSGALLLAIIAAAGVEGVYTELPPSVRARRLGTGTFIPILRWWRDASLSAASRTLDGVVRAVKTACDAADIAMPYPKLIVRQPDLGD